MTTSVTRSCFTKQQQDQDQDQDHNVQDQDQDHSVQDQDRFFWSQTGLVLRPTVSDYITDAFTQLYIVLLLRAAKAHARQFYPATTLAINFYTTEMPGSS